MISKQNVLVTGSPGLGLLTAWLRRVMTAKGADQCGLFNGAPQWCRAGRRAAAGLAGLLSALLGRPAYAQIEGGRRSGQEWQLALLPSLTVPLTNRVELFTLGAYIQDLQAITVLQTDVRFHPGPVLTLTPGYFGVYLPKVNGVRDTDHRARLAVGLATPPAQRLRLSTQVLVERRFRRSEHSTRLRPRLRGGYPLPWGAGSLFVFGFTEPFYDFRARRWVRNHSSLGVECQLAKRFTAGLSWYRQFIAGEPDVNSAMLTLALKLPQLGSSGAAGPEPP